MLSSFKDSLVKKKHRTRLLLVPILLSSIGYLVAQAINSVLLSQIFAGIFFIMIAGLTIQTVRTMEARISASIRKLRIHISQSLEMEPLRRQQARSASLETSLRTLEDEHRTLEDEHRNLVTSTEDKLARAQALFLINTEKMRQEARALAAAEKGRPKSHQEISLGSSRANRGAYYGIGPDSYYGEKYHRDIHFGERFIMRTNSKNARQIVARSVTNLQFDLDELLMFIRADNANLLGENFIRVLKSWHLKSLLSLARILANQALVKTDSYDSVAIYAVIIKHFGLKTLRFDDTLIYLETLQAIGLDDTFDNTYGTAQQILDIPIQFGLLACNNLVRKSGSVFLTSDSWVKTINALYSADNLAELSITGGSGDLLDHLGVNAPPVNTGPLVSVIMPTYNGSDQIHTAINSVLNQSWRQLELIIVDDGSDEHHFRILQDLCSGNERITLIRLELNQGAYPARNAGFRSSRGQFITVHDDDDWSHPQKIQRQVEHLLENPEIIGNMSYQSRIDESFLFVRINDNPEFNQRNYSSMMMQRELVEAVGMWDEVNRGGDAEFHDRVQAITGKKIEGVLSAPLSFTRVRSNSLTAGEIRKGFIDYGRQTYALAYMNWHQELSKGTTEIGTLDTPSRPFDLPESLKPTLRRAHRGHFDLVYVTDLRFSGGNTSLVTAEIRAALELGLKVAVAQLDSPTLRSRRPWDAKVQDLLRERSVPIISLDDDASTSILVLRHPTIMQYADRLESNIDARAVYLVVNNPPMGLGGVESVFDVQVCEENARRAFSIMPVIAPESSQTRRLCVSLSPGANYASTDWPGFIDPDSFAVERDSHSWRASPVVGRHSRDHRLKWPDTVQDISAAYLQPDLFSTSVLGGADSILDLLPASAAASLNVLPFGSMNPADYLRTIDFWVYFHSEDWTESFGMAIAEAMAAGLVVVLPPYFETMFGDGAIYSRPNDVADIVKNFWLNKDLYLAQGERARRVIRERYSVQSYQDRLLALLSQVAVGAQMVGAVEVTAS